MYHNENIIHEDGLPASSSATSNIHKRNDSQPPEHLSEFLSFVNRSKTSLTPQQSPSVRDYQLSEFKNKRVARQPSLNTFTSFTPSVLDLPNILTSKDFEASVQSYQTLLNKAQTFRSALLEVSKAASEFGQALEDTINENPKVNNSKQVSDGLINAGSLQYIVGSNNQILSRLLHENFEIPLEQELQKLKSSYKANHDYYQQEVKAKSQELRRKELENIRLSKLKTRNLSVYKNNLINLTSQLDEIDRLKYDYYLEINSMLETFNQSRLLIHTGSIIRAELELFEGIARKGWSGGGLDQLLEISPDLFAVDYEEDDQKVSQEQDGRSERNSEHSLDGHSEANQTLETIRQANKLPNPDLIQDSSSINQDNEVDKSARDLSNLTLDESFSLPKVNTDSLHRTENYKDYTNQDILNDTVE